MAGRDYKVGLDYFELDCHMDDKIRLIEAEYGLKGFAIVVKLYQSIYAGLGYYCEWTPDIALLWAMQFGISPGGAYGEVGSAPNNGSLPGFPKNLINDVVAASIRRNIFSEELFREYRILTSSGIQKRYLNATSKRGRVELKKEYLLVDVDKNSKNVVINSIYDGRNPISDTTNGQSREKKRKEKIKTMCRADAHALFEGLWQMYPVKKGKGQVSDAQKMKLSEIGFDEMSRALERYKKYVEDTDYLHYQNGSTFFNSGYIDYLDANYTPDHQKRKGGHGQFCQCMQNDYDFAQLEKEIVSN